MANRRLKHSPLTVATSHTSAQVAHGDVWMVFQNVKESEAQYTVYLSSFGSAAYTQNGHEPASTTEVEKKILANMIFYMFVNVNGMIK